MAKFLLGSSSGGPVSKLFNVFNFLNSTGTIFIAFPLTDWIYIEDFSVKK